MAFIFKILGHKFDIVQILLYTEKTTLFSVVFMVDDTRLELVTSRTSSGCATSCANRPGGDKRDRTADLLNAIHHKRPINLGPYTDFSAVNL